MPHGVAMKIAGKRVLVTGGAGFVGSHLVDLLAPANEVTVLDDMSVGTPSNLSSSPHVNVLTAIPDPMASHLVNDLGTLNLLLAARDSSLQRFVYVSSSEVYGSAMRVPMDEQHPLNPATPYAAAKLAGEAYALSFHRTYGVPATVVRPFNVYGPREHVDGTSGEVIPRFVARAMADKPLVVFGDGLQRRSVTSSSVTASTSRAARK